MNKKGVVGLVAAIIGAVIALVLLANFFIPQVKQVTQGTYATESLIHNNAPSAQNRVLSKTTAGYELESGSLSIAGLTYGANYTVNYNNGTVRFNATKCRNGTYVATYNYYESGYVETGSERVLLAFIVLVGILGAAVLVFRGFGLYE